MKELPFNCAKTFEDLLSNIENFDIKKYKNNVDVFMKNYGYVDKKDSANLIAKYILEERNFK